MKKLKQTIKQLIKQQINNDNLTKTFVDNEGYEVSFRYIDVTHCVQVSEHGQGAV